MRNRRNPPLQKVCNFFFFDGFRVYVSVKIYFRCGLKTEHIQEYTSFCLPISENCFSLEQCLEAYTAEEERSIQCADCKAPSMIFSSKFHTLPRY